VIGSRIGGISELIHDGENGFLFESRNERQLTKSLNTLSSSILTEFSHKILRDREMYGIKVHIQNLRVLYKNILDNSKRKNGCRSIYNETYPVI
jgi:glycosyltransferase involved in cell wall biosynthesis